MKVIDINRPRKIKIEKCKKCNNKINPKEDRTYLEEYGRVCLSCFFDRGDIEMIAEVSVDDVEQ